MASAGSTLLAVAFATAAIVSFPQEAQATSCVSGPFMVFFDWDDDRITKGAQPILDNLVLSFGNCGLDGPVVIEAHTDRSGPSDYNISLALRRAESVRAYLSTHGLGGKEMVTRSFGESRPLIETSDGAQKAENRRAEIMLTPPTGW